MHLSTNEKPLLDDTRIDEVVSAEQIGVWEFLTVKQPRWNLLGQWSELKSIIFPYRRLAFEIYTLSPGLLFLYILSKIWIGIEQALSLYLSSRVLQVIEIGLREGQVDMYGIYSALAARLSCVVFLTLLQWWCDKTLPGLKTHIIRHYEICLIRARLRLDLATAQEPDLTSDITSEDSWRAFEAALSLLGQILTSASQLYFIVHTSRSNGSTFFALLCIAKPMIQAFYSDDIWSKECVVHANNPHHARMRALLKLSSDRYRQDYNAGNITDYIMAEYEKASQNLGDICVNDWWDQCHKQDSWYFSVCCEIIGDLPMVYCAINAVAYPSKFSVASVAVLQHSSMDLRESIGWISTKVMSFRQCASRLKHLHAISEIKMMLKEGDISYPGPHSEDAGMGFELQNVSFAYPGAGKTNALNNVSLSIKPGQLVVIVGANGSGKSTIIRLLSRLYDPSSGTILIDDIPTSQYHTPDLRQGIALFAQDHNLYPLSIYENIALGHPAHLSNTTLVAEAAEKGGAAEFIAKLPNGMETKLEPFTYIYPINVPADPEHPLQKKMQTFQKEIDISGGERQRVIASRTFMRLDSGKVKFVAVDEPTSALDAEGEAQLFDRLLEARSGKTMVFVTHRFAHLTKFADIILCMNDGAIAESGTHDELLRLGGEYSKLYNIQASAFRADQS